MRPVTLFALLLASGTARASTDSSPIDLEGSGLSTSLDFALGKWTSSKSRHEWKWSSGRKENVDLNGSSLETLPSSLTLTLRLEEWELALTKELGVDAAGAIALGYWFLPWVCAGIHLEHATSETEEVSRYAQGTASVPDYSHADKSTNRHTMAGAFAKAAYAQAPFQYEIHASLGLEKSASELEEYHVKGPNKPNDESGTWLAAGADLRVALARSFLLGTGLEFRYVTGKNKRDVAGSSLKEMTFQRTNYTLNALTARVLW